MAIEEVNPAHAHARIRPFVQNRVPFFVHRADGAGVAERVGDALGDPAGDVQAFGQMAGVELPGEFAVDEAHEVVGGSNPQRLVDLSSDAGLQ